MKLRFLENFFESLNFFYKKAPAPRKRDLNRKFSFRGAGVGEGYTPLMILSPEGR